MPGVEIHVRHQVQESFLQRDVGAVGGPHLIHRRDPPEIHKGGKLVGLITWERGAGLLVDRPQTHAAHEASDTVTTDRNPFSSQVGDDSPTATIGIL